LRDLLNAHCLDLACVLFQNFLRLVFLFLQVRSVGFNELLNRVFRGRDTLLNQRKEL
jgi:hypothetical protein